ncbi:MAG: alpha/beta fold hydrolase [Chloroflexota bacterium]
MPIFEREGIAFNYLDIGRGRPVVWQHGLGGSSAQAPAVTGGNPPFRLLSLDCRGHGETGPMGDPERLSFTTFADDVAAMMDHAGVERAVLAGMSMGAGVALTFALRHPGRVEALVLIRPAWLDRGMPDNLALFPEIARLLRDHGPEEGMARFLAKPSPVNDDPPGSLSMLATQFGRPGAVERAAVLERMAGDCPPAGAAAWGAVGVPTLVIATEQDSIHPAAFGRALAAAIPGAELVEPVSKWIDEDRHNRAVQAASLEFLARRAPGAV